MRANKGEWCEFYTFLKILDEKKVYIADKELNIIKDKFFIFQRVFKEDVTFDITGKGIKIINSKNEVLKCFDDQNLALKQS